ncbi:MAG: UDP-N-acetylglucosamine--N-acetylmuramyl-(pentapeptide) pyrophosphoryl-undecaprenol N-acetylglucosamine transferase [Patescibacteria group bacterium]|jgi:UDP-N-acetylglucosamine--N-acetylmuramyl-(pentapeptide) pyrophosphoryl-undecaprenol N-acetylglucosamine transferase
MMHKTIVFTGGHHNSALVLAKHLKEHGFSILWFGHKYTMKGVSNISSEYQEVTKEGIKFIELHSGKIHKGNIIEVFKTIGAIIYCFLFFLKKRPNLIISFGGYLAVPPVIAGWCLRIPAIGHEQTTILGMANKLLLPFYHKLYTSWPISGLGSSKLKVVGLPVDIQVFQEFTVRELEKYFFEPKKPLLVVSGGKQGSHVINTTVEKALPKLLPLWNVYHQTGSNSQTQDFERMRAFRRQLPYKLRKSYLVTDYSKEFKRFLATATLVVGRSGAHTVYEVLMLGKKMVAIPLPFSYMNEQHNNAQLLEKLSLGVILPQEKLTAETLVEAVLKVTNLKPSGKKLPAFQKNIKHAAAAVMIEDIKELTKPSYV